MSTSHPISRMCPPVPGEKVPGVTFSYFNARNRRRIFNLIIDELKKSGITRTELAVRTGKSLALMSRLPIAMGWSRIQKENLYKSF